MRIAPQRLPALVHGQSAVSITSVSFNSQQRQQQQPQRLPDHGHPETVRQHLPPLLQRHQLNIPHAQQQQQRPVFGGTLQQTHVNVPRGQQQQQRPVWGGAATVNARSRTRETFVCFQADATRLT